MKKIKIASATVLSVVLLIIIVSCKKNVNGCTDAASDNHNVEANVDDGSCSYHGNLTAWYDNATRDSLLANNVTSVDIFVDNESFQTINPTFILWSAEPECNTATIGNWVTMTGTTNRTISLHVEAKNGASVVQQWDETIMIEANDCELYKIAWQ